MPFSRHHLSPSISSDLASREPGFLADLSPTILSEVGKVEDEVVDGFVNFWRPTIFIFRYGSDFAAKFSAKYTDGYGINDMRNISNIDIPITQMTDFSDRGNYWPYSKDNVIGICGVAFEERNVPDRFYKLRKSVWVKIKWRNISTMQKIFLKGNYCWVPGYEFARLCGSKDSQKVKSWKPGRGSRNAT
jgi:hypothetical protein